MRGEERQTDRARQTDTDRDRERHRKKQRQTDRETEKERDGRGRDGGGMFVSSFLYVVSQHPNKMDTQHYIAHTYKTNQ